MKIVKSIDQIICLLDILNDIEILENINYDIYGDSDLFLKNLQVKCSYINILQSFNVYREAQTEIDKTNLNNEFEKVKIFCKYKHIYVFELMKEKFCF